MSTCIIDSKLDCFDCKVSKSCDKCLKRITQIKLYSTKNNKLKRLPPDENGYMLPRCVGEDIVEQEERNQTQVSHGKGNATFVELNHDIYIKSRKRCRRCYIQNRRK